MNFLNLDLTKTKVLLNLGLKSFVIQGYKASIVDTGWKLLGSSKKTGLLTTTLVIHFSSRLKKRGKKKRRMNIKNRDP